MRKAGDGLKRRTSHASADAALYRIKYDFDISRPFQKGNIGVMIPYVLDIDLLLFQVSFASTYKMLS
jgi:hypothetical protein